MTAAVERSAEWIYRGVWLMLVECFKVPKDPPTMPVGTDDFCHKFHPSRRYLAYLKMFFWIGLTVIDVLILVGWVAVYLWKPWVGWMLLAPALFLAVVPDIVAYIAIHLRYDTMWYVITDRSCRLRRGVWTVVEHTITFENVQNVYLRRGPIQQLFGISTLVIETAGASEDEGEDLFSVGNKAIMEGLENPDEIRELIMERVRRSRTTGLGDERAEQHWNGWNSQSIGMLKEIRDEIQLLD